MKLKNVILGVALLVASLSFGQEKGASSFYIGGVYNADAGAEAGFTYGITDEIDAVASFTYYFGGSGVTRYNINLDARYYLGGSDSMKYYGLAGVSRYTSSVTVPIIGKVTASGFGFNAGGGLLFSMGDSMDIIAQAKYGSAGSGGFEPMVGISFKF